MNKTIQVEEKLKEIIKRVTGVSIEEGDVSLFSPKNNIRPHEVAYILLIAGNELGFEIDTELVDSFEECSFRKLADAISVRI